MFSNVENPKQVAILTAAFDVFASYGFKRTSMDDIAKAAGVSRPALYQSFSNKVDIYTAIVTSFCNSVQLEWQNIVQSDRSAVERLSAVFKIAVVEPHAMMENMPHGEEIIGLKHDFAQDVFEDFNAKLHAVFVEILMSAETSEEFSNDLANMLTQAVAGMKANGLSSSELDAGFDALLRVVAVSLQRSA